MIAHQEFALAEVVGEVLKVVARCCTSVIYYVVGFGRVQFKKSFLSPIILDLAICFARWKASPSDEWFDCLFDT